MIGMASWSLNRMAGLRVADRTAGPGFFTTKSFVAQGNSITLALHFDTGGERCVGSVLVELLDDASKAFASTCTGCSMPVVSTPVSAASLNTQAQWKQCDPRLMSDAARVVANSTFRLRFSLLGSARVFAFRIRFDWRNPVGSNLESSGYKTHESTGRISSIYASSMHESPRHRRKHNSSRHIRAAGRGAAALGAATFALWCIPAPHLGEAQYPQSGCREPTLWEGSPSDECGLLLWCRCAARRIHTLGAASSPVVLGTSDLEVEMDI